MYPEIGKPFINFTMSDIIRYVIEVSADITARKDFKSLRESCYKLLKAGHIHDFKAEVWSHCVIHTVYVLFLSRDFTIPNDMFVGHSCFTLHLPFK